MISIHEKILQYFKNHNIGSGIKLTNANDDEEDKNKTQKVEESKETEVVAVEPTSTSSSARKSLVAKLKALDEKLKGSNDEEILQTIEYTPLTEEEIKASQLFYKDSLKYRATLSVVLKVSSDNGQSSAQTSIEAWRELTMPIDTSIEEKEKYWNEMVQKLFEEFNVRMEQNINQYLNMYVANNTTVYEY